MNKKQKNKPQEILVFQQNGSGESKIKGIHEYGENFFSLKIISIDEDLPPVIDDAADYLPDDIRADIVLDFLKHPDLSHDLAIMCRDRNIPVITSGKKIRVKGAISPPT